MFQFPGPSLRHWRGVTCNGNTEEDEEAAMGHRLQWVLGSGRVHSGDAASHRSPSPFSPSPARPLPGRPPCQAQSTPFHAQLHVHALRSFLLPLRPWLLPPPSPLSPARPQLVLFPSLFLSGFSVFLLSFLSNNYLIAYLFIYWHPPSPPT